MTLTRKSAYAALIVLAFFAIAELAFLAFGVKPLLADRDPLDGFEGGLRVFERGPGRDVIATAERATRQSFNYQEFVATKPANGFRLFTLGGSSAYGFPWGADAAFTRALGDALAEAWPGRVVEAVNAAGMSYGSRRLRILAGEVASYQPDLIIFFEGHNEFVERHLSRLTPASGATARGIRPLLDRWRLYAVMTRLLRPMTSTALQARGAGERPAGRTTGELLGLDVERVDRTGTTARDKEEVRARFEENLRAIVKTATDAGARTVLCTVPANDRDWRPNQSIFDAATAEATRRRALDLFARAQEAVAGNDTTGALRDLEEARRLAPGYAGIEFLLGRVYEVSARYDDARTAYRAARDDDGQPVRALTSINDTIRRVAADRGAILVDVERLFEEASPHGVIGFDLLEDYVHPKPEGQRLIARAIYSAIAKSETAGSVRDLTPAEFDRIVDAARAKRGGTDAEAPARRTAALFNSAIVLENQGEAEQAIAKYRAVLAITPSHYAARCNLGRLLNEIAQPAEAVEELGRGLEVAPDNLNCLLELGRGLTALGRAREAEEIYRSAAERDSESALAWRGWGMALAQQGSAAEAAPKFQKAADLDPMDADAFAYLAQADLALSRIDESVAAFRRSLALDPRNHRALIGLAAALIAKGESAEAERIYRDVLAADPDDEWALRGLHELKPGAAPRR